MFTLTSTLVTFAGLLILFAWSLVWSVRDAIKAPTVVTKISTWVHVVMAVTMILMVPKSWWKPLVSAIGGPTTPVVIFAICTAWMVFMAAWRSSWSSWGHAAMFAAMVWHLAAMRKMSSVMTASKHSGMGTMNHGGMDHGMNHGGMGHGMNGSMDHGMQTAMNAAMHDFAVVGIPLMVALLALAIAGLCRAISGKAENPRKVPTCHVVATEPLAIRLSALADFAMAFGMFWMSTGLLTPIMPFMEHLHP